MSFPQGRDRGEGNVNKEDIIRVVQQVAPGFDLDPALVCGIIQRESSFSPAVTRFEPAFKERYLDKLHLPEDETKARATSYGLMQLLGESAREMGFAEPLVNLLDPDTNITWGCRWLKHKMALAKGDVSVGLLYWNGGENLAYPDDVLALAEQFKQGSVA